MEPHIHHEKNTLSLSDLHIKDDTMIHPQEDSKQNQNSSSSSSSSPSSSFDQDFLGFFSEEWSRVDNTSPENIIFCGKLLSSKQPIVAGDVRESQPNPQFRSNSDSFRYMRFKTASNTPRTSRSKSLPNRSSTPCKSRWKVFLFGFGSGKFLAKMDMSEIKIRQLRRQSDRTVVDEERRSGKKGWWRLVDVLGCSGGYERDAMVVNAHFNKASLNESRLVIC